MSLSRTDLVPPILYHEFLFESCTMGGDRTDHDCWVTSMKSFHVLQYQNCHNYLDNTTTPFKFKTTV